MGFDIVIMADFTAELSKLSATEYFENIWDSYKPKERKEFLKEIGLDEKTTKKKFISIMEFKWIEFALKDNNWDKFMNSFKKEG